MLNNAVFLIELNNGVLLSNKTKQTVNINKELNESPGNYAEGGGQFQKVICYMTPFT